MAASSHSRIRSLDIPIIDKVFDMEGGYVLNFTNLTFAEFFREELGVDIDIPRWAVRGGSKAKRLRFYLRQADRQTALDTLNALWEYREASSITADYPELDDSLLTAYYRIIERLGGNPPEPVSPTAAHRKPRIDEAATSALASCLVEVSKMDPQPRGYAFEKFLKDVFDAMGCPRAHPSGSPESRSTAVSSLGSRLICSKRGGEMRWSTSRRFVPSTQRLRTRQAGPAA